MESTLRRGAGAPGLKLIETLGWDGFGFIRLELHLARLSRSAAMLGWGCDIDAVKQALFGVVKDCSGRVRLTLSAHGQIAATVAEMPATAASWRVGLAAARLSSGDVWLTVKSTNRGAYDLERASLTAGLDEAIFLNEHAEVCDGSITTVFFDAGQGLCTPPLVCGLLPGVLRAEMLAAGTAREAVLQVADLGRVQLWLGNSLRGLIPAVFVHQIGA